MRTVEEAMRLLAGYIPEEDRERYRVLFERFPKLRESAEYVMHFSAEPSLALV